MIASWVADAVLNPPNELIYLILTSIPGGKCYHYTHLRNGKTELHKS